MNKVYKFFFFSVSVLFLLIGSSCTKIDTTSLGQDLIPPIDGVNTLETDTFKITTENFLFNDSTRLNKTDAYLLGQLVTDPLFGRTDATIYTELKPNYPFRWRALKDSIILLPNGGYDSSFVNLAFQSAGTEKGIYGDSNSTISVRVWAITDNTNFKRDSNYAITIDPNIPHGTLIGTTSFRPADLKNERIKILKRDTIRTTHTLRVRLNSTGDAIMSDLLSKDTSNVFKNDDNFRAQIKGFVFEPVGAGGNAIVKFDLDNSKTNLEIWYRFKNGTGVTDTTYDTFGFTPGYGDPYQSASANYVQRSTGGAPFLSYLAPGADSVIMLQSTPGTYGKIQIPSMKSFPNKIIHRAELIMDENPVFSHPFYTPPLNIYLDVFDTGAAGKFRTVPYDFYFINILTGQVDFGYFGGQRTTVTDANGTRARYIFNVTKYLQGMATRNDQYYDLRVYCPFDTRYHNQFVSGFPWPVITSPTFGRVALGGGSSTRYRMRLHVVYSNI